MANEKKMDCVILGLLSHEPMTGYEIKKHIDYSLRFFWGASYGSIYPTLNSLMKDEMVTKKETKENGREKIIYTITDKGHQRLKDWLKEPAEKNELRFETLRKLFFGGEIGGQETLQHILAFEDKAKEELQHLERCVDSLMPIQGEVDHQYYLLTAQFGVEIYKTYLAWCKQTEKVLKQMNKR